ncbi:chemotaxis protein CheW [Ramlibacter agri]
MAEPYLSFQLGADMYAVGILSVREIIEYPELTPVPMAPAAVRGVINLRGAVVPVVDPQVRFGKPASAPGRRTCIVIVETTLADGSARTAGVVVDAVSEVVDIAAEDIEPPPTFGTRLRTELLRGVAKVRGRFVILLDPAPLLDLDLPDEGDFDPHSLPEPLAA